VYWLNRSKTLELTVGSRSKFSRSLQRLFSLASTRYCYSMPTTSDQDKPSTRQEYQVKKSITLDPTVGLCSNFHRSLRRLFSLVSKRYRYSMPLASYRARPPTKPEYRLNRSLTFDPTDASCPNFYRCFQRLFSYTSQWNRYSTPTKSDWARPRSRQEYRLNKSIPLISTVGSCSTFYSSLRRPFSVASQWNRYSTPTTSGRARPAPRLEYRLNKSITLDPTIGSCSNFYMSFRWLFSLAL
jgi:hypothetical protein